MNPQANDEGPRYPVRVRSEAMWPENMEFLGRFGYTDLYRLLTYGRPYGIGRVNESGDSGYSVADYYLSGEGRKCVSPEAREFLKAYVQLMR